MENKEKTTLDNFVEFIDRCKEIEEMREQEKDPRSENSEKAKEKIKKDTYEIYTSLLEQGIEPFANWRYIVDADSMNKAQREEVLGKNHLDCYKAAVNLLHKEPSEISAKMSEKNLEALVLEKDEKGKNMIRQYIAENDEKTYLLYERVVKIEDAKKRFENGERSDYITSFYEGNVKRGFIEETIKCSRRHNEDSDQEEYAVACAKAAIERGDINPTKIDNYAKSGFDKLISDAKRTYEASIKDSKRDIYAIVRDAVAKGAQDPSVENFNKLFRAVYNSIKKDKKESK